MNIKFLSFVILLFAFSGSYAQPVIHFEQRLHDFGTIKEVSAACFACAQVPMQSEKHSAKRSDISQILILLFVITKTAFTMYWS